jgi:DNA polymerase-3 subunit gamma/tau
LTAGIPHQAIYRRWRAQTFSEIVGQEAVVATLRNAVTSGRVAHAILFTGPRGTGKTSLARIVAKALNCENLQPNGDPCDVCPPCVAIREGRALDLIEIDAASNRGIDAVRDLRERLSYAPTDLRRKVYILDEAHQITRDAWNALLKSLEEPPEFVTFMFASTHPQEFPPAILSRLQRFDVRRLTVPEISGKLERILAADGREADPEAIDLVARLAAGGMRDAESILDQLLASTSDRIEADAVRELLGLADAELVDRYVAALAEGDAASGIRVLDDLETRGRDLRMFLDQVVDTMRDRLLAELSGSEPAAPNLGRAARQIAAIDPTRLGPGGLRFQLELTLLTAGWRTDTSSIDASPAVTAAGPGVQGPSADAAEVPARRPSGQRSIRRPAVDSDAVRPGGPPGAAAAPMATADVAGAPAPGPVGDVRPSAASAVPADDARETETISIEAAATGADRAATTISGKTSADVAGEGEATAGAANEGDAETAGGDLERLRVGWSGVVADVTERNRAAKPLITACRPIGVEGRMVTLGFPEEQGFLKDVAERRRALLEESIGGYLGHPVAVRCVATNLDLLPSLPSDDDGAHLLAEAHRIFADDLAEAPEIN